MTAFVVVNPRAGNGRTGRDWPQIRDSLESAFPRMHVALSHGRGQTTQLVRAALRDGHLDIIVVGGDGTINEAVNGFFEQGAPVSPDAVLGFVASGTDSDFARSLGIASNYQASIARLEKSHIRKVDVGRLSCLSLQGEPLTRHFVNVASFGLSARIARTANRSRFARLLGNRFAFAAHAILSLIGWRSPRLRLIADQGYDEIAGITMVAVANGRWSGAGMNVAPAANLSDGKFDVMVAGGAPRRRMLKTLAGLRGGAFLSGPEVRVVRAARFTAAPTLDTMGQVDIETDGESAGVLPATFEILPSAIKLRV